MKCLLLVVLLAALITPTASATSTARQFAYGIGTYERAVASSVNRWKNTGTRCQFRSGRTLVYCLTATNKWGAIRTTMRRTTPTKVRFTMTFLDMPQLSRSWVGPGR